MSVNSLTISEYQQWVKSKQPEIVGSEVKTINGKTFTVLFIEENPSCIDECTAIANAATKTAVYALGAPFVLAGSLVSITCCWITAVGATNIASQSYDEALRKLPLYPSSRGAQILIQDQKLRVEETGEKKWKKKQEIADEIAQTAMETSGALWTLNELFFNCVDPCNYEDPETVITELYVQGGLPLTTQQPGLQKVLNKSLLCLHDDKY